MRLPFAIALVAASFLARAPAAQVHEGSAELHPNAAAALGPPGLDARTQTPLPDPVHAARIDVLASDARGEVVKDLASGDFDVREDGVARVVESVRFGNVSPRLLGIFLDEYHVTAGPGAARARAAMTRFVDEELRPEDLIVVMRPLDSLHTLQPTGDRDVARRAIAAFEGRRGDYAPRNAYETHYVAGNPARIEASRLQIAVSAINALALELGRRAEGRKTLIVVTEALARTTRSRGGEYLATIDTVIRSANRSNVSIYAVDPRATPPAADVEAPEQEGVRAVTTQTDGTAVAGGDLGAAVRRIGRDSSGYYLLTYRAAHNGDGKFHHVEVRVRRPGVRVRVRAGYWASRPDEARRAALVAGVSASSPASIEPVRHVSPLIRPWFGLSRADSGKTRVTFVWEAAAPVPGDRALHYPSRIVLTARSVDGVLIFDGRVSPTGPAAAGDRTGTLARAVFDTSPGRVRLQMKIQDDKSRVIDSDVRDLAIREWREAVAIGTPEVLRARNARELRSLASDPAAAPAASREFSRAERLLVRVPAYAPPGVVPTVSARLLGRSGQAMRELNVAAASAPGGPHQVDVPLAGLASGEYAIELAAVSSVGEAKERLEFRVTN